MPWSALRAEEEDVVVVVAVAQEVPWDVPEPVESPNVQDLVLDRAREAREDVEADVAVAVQELRPRTTRKWRSRQMIGPNWLI